MARCGISVCRGLLLMLERAGQITLPPGGVDVRHNPLSRRARPEPVLIDKSPISVYPLTRLQPIEFELGCGAPRRSRCSTA